MNKIVWSKQFKKQFHKILRHQSFKRAVFEQIIAYLTQDKKLDPQYHDHPLKGKLHDYRECHIAPDILLVYKKDNNLMIIVLIRIGSHSNLFN